MEVVFALPLLAIPLFFPVVGGLMAKSFGRSFWFWFWLSLPLPLIAHSILLCLPEKEQVSAMADNETAMLKAVTNNHQPGESKEQLSERA